MPAPRPRGISDILPKLQRVAQTSKFLVKFVLPNSPLRTHMRKKGINDRFISDNIGLLCSDAVLPGSNMASSNIAGDYQGLVEKFAHTRQFTQISFDFYVDLEYKSLKFLEHWMEYISGQSNADPSRDSYHFKIAYPDEYKSNDTRIVKFEADHFQFLEYRFIGLFPIALNSTRVSYQNSTILKATASFSFDRYVFGESNSLARALGIDLNNRSRRTGNGTINYNSTASLNEVMDGVSLLNRDTIYQYGPRTTTGSDTSRDAPQVPFSPPYTR